MKNILLKIIFTFLYLAQFSLGTVVIDNPSTGTININVSQTSINRLVLPSKIIDIAYSKEKGLDILNKKGIILVTCYPHKEGKIESNKILVEYNKKEYDKLLNKRLVLLKYMDQ